MNGGLTQTFNFEAIGTYWRITLSSPLARPAYAALQQQIHERIDMFDRTYSRFRADSLVTAMSLAAGSYQLPDDAEALLDFYQKLYEVTEGQVTPLIGQAISDAGYDANYSLQPKQLQPVPAWDQVLSYDFPSLTLHKPALLDFGAAGKGYLVDIVAALIRAAGVDSFSVNGGGDIVNYQAAPALARIGLEHPEHRDEVIGIATVPTGSLCASSGNRRAWGRFTHIISPSALTSPTQISASWVAAESGLIADGLATALFFCEPRQLRAHFPFEYALVHHDGSLTHSADFPAEFFTEESGA